MHVIPPEIIASVFQSAPSLFIENKISSVKAERCEYIFEKLTFSVLEEGLFFEFHATLHNFLLKSIVPSDDMRQIWSEG